MSKLNVNKAWVAGLSREMLEELLLETAVITNDSLQRCAARLHVATQEGVRETQPANRPTNGAAGSSLPSQAQEQKDGVAASGRPSKRQAVTSSGGGAVTAAQSLGRARAAGTAGSSALHILQLSTELLSNIFAYLTARELCMVAPAVCTFAPHPLVKGHACRCCSAP